MKYPTFEITDEGRDLLDDNSKQDWFYQPGDYNKDGTVNVLDMIIVGQATKSI